MDRMLRSNVRGSEHMKIGDYVYYWRDNSGWLCPAYVIAIYDHILTLVHDEKTVNSSCNRVQRTQPPSEDLVLEEDEHDYVAIQSIPRFGQAIPKRTAL